MQELDTDAKINAMQQQMDNMMAQVVAAEETLAKRDDEIRRLETDMQQHRVQVEILQAQVCHMILYCLRLLGHSSGD